MRCHRRDGGLSAEVVDLHHRLLLEALVVELARALKMTDSDQPHSIFFKN